MSISFEIYDFFSYTIPGLLYLFVLNQALTIFKFPNINFDTLNSNLGYAFIGVVLAYLTGHLMDMSAREWFFLFYKDKLQRRLIDRLKERYPELKIEFDIHDLRVLFSFICHNKPDVAETIEKYKALNIMLQNVSLALLLVAVYEIVNILYIGFNSFSAVLAGGGIWFSIVALRRSALFNDWYWSAIFTQALHYGTNVNEMFGKQSKKILKKKRMKDAVK